MRRRWLSVCLAAVVSTALSLARATAQELDLNAYDALLDASMDAHEALGHSDEATSRLFDGARAADLALLEWLDATMQSAAFGDLDEAEQISMIGARSRVEFNLARTLIAADRCPEARVRLRSLLDGAFVDEELRSRLIATYDEAVECEGRVRTALLTVDATPERAEVIVAGEFIGLADVAHSIPLGQHVVTIAADGYQPQDFALNAQVEGEDLSIGPVTLTAIEIDTGKSPNAGEWVLWGGGAVGIGTSVALFVAAADKESTNETYVRGGGTIGNADVQQEEIDRWRLGGYVAGGVGIAAVILGTVLYVTRDSETTTVEDAVSWGPVFSPSTVGAQLQIQFR